MIKHARVQNLNFVGIGRKGENLATTVDIDCTVWLAAHPDGVLSLRYHFPGTSTEDEPLVTVVNGHLLWSITSVETAVEGHFEAMVRLEDEGAIVLSRVFTCAVEGGFEPSTPVTVVTSPITSIKKVMSDGLVDYYAITCADGSVFEFTLTNGADGASGADGADGADGRNGEDGEDGVSPTVEFTPVEGGWSLAVTDAYGTHSVELRPYMLDSVAVVQGTGDNPAAVMSQAAVTDALGNIKPGWSEEQVNLLEAAVNLFSVFYVGIPFKTDAAASSATAYVEKMRELVRSLRGSHPLPTIVIEIKDGYVSTNATALSVEDGKIILR